MDDTIQVIQLAMSTETNLILYGKGGYGKSELSKQMLKDAGYKVNTIVGHSGTQVEQLFGIPNMKKLMDDSEYELAFEKSPFINADVLILEEFLDVPPDVSSALKDVISEGGYRAKNKFIKSNVKFIIICTNKSPDEMESTDSYNAFYKERFPLHHEVVWRNHPTKYYEDLFKYNTELENEAIVTLSQICSAAKISPRLALTAAAFYEKTKDFASIGHINGFKHLDIQELSKHIVIRNKVQQFDEMIRSVLVLIDKHRDNIGVLLYIKDEVENFTTDTNLENERAGSFFTLINSINMKIKSIHFTFKSEIDAKHKREVDEIFANIKDISA